MRTYLFSTVTTENSSDFWIDGNIVSDFKVSANNLNEAKQKYFEFVENTAYITISKSQRIKANKMYIYTKDGKTIQTGFVFVGSTDIDFNYQWKKRYASLWCTISEIKNAFE